MIGHADGFSINVKSYTEEITKTDKLVGELLSCLKKRTNDMKKDEEWLVVITTDHGGSLIEDEHRKTFQGYPLPDEEKGFHGLDRPDHRTVFIIFKNLQWNEGREIIPAPLLVDLFCSILDFFGVPYPDDIEGISFLQEKKNEKNV